MLRGILLTGLGYCETNALTVMVNTSTNIKEKKSINSECQQNEQSPLTSTHLMQKKKKRHVTLEIQVLAMNSQK